MKIVAITPDKKHDFLTETVIEGFKNLGAKIINTDPGNGLKDVYSDQDVINESKTADLILVFFGKVRDNRPPKYYLLDQINRPEITAYIDGSEWTFTGNPSPGQVQSAKSNPSMRRGEPWNNSTMLDKSRCNFYFKRECYAEDVSLGLIPLPFGVVTSSIVQNNHPKKYDIFCCFGQTNDGLRKETLEYCRSLRQAGYKVFDTAGVPKHVFLEALASSKIAIDAWGGGDCCARFWEIVGNGVACLYQKYNIVIPEPFSESSAVSFSSLEEFKTKLHYLLDNEIATRDIAKNGEVHALCHHTALSRANYILKHVKQ